jgi:hypothetical protein
MDCTICGKTTLPGAKLCGPCKAALKRARYVTVEGEIRLPSVIDVRRQQRRPRTSAVAPESVKSSAQPNDATFESWHGRRLFVAIALFAMALVGVTYFGQRGMGARAQDDAPVAASAVPVPRPGDIPFVAESQPANIAMATPPINSRLVSPRAGDAISGSKPAGIVVAKRSKLPAGASFATANGDPPEAIPVAPEPQKSAAAAPPPPRVVPDRWQNMRDALAQCDSEGIIGGFICGQRVRMQYCDGYWGKVAQCPGAAAAYER